jgi:hypothetical protein
MGIKVLSKAGTFFLMTVSMPSFHKKIIILEKLNRNFMWGANKWTDGMFKKYWWLVMVLIMLYIVFRMFLY